MTKYAAYLWFWSACVYSTTITAPCNVLRNYAYFAKKKIDVNNDLDKDLTSQYAFSLYDTVINFPCRLWINCSRKSWHWISKNVTYFVWATEKRHWKQRRILAGLHKIVATSRSRSLVAPGALFFPSKFSHSLIFVLVWFSVLLSSLLWAKLVSVICWKQTKFVRNFRYPGR